MATSMPLAVEEAMLDSSESDEQSSREVGRLLGRGQGISNRTLRFIVVGCLGLAAVLAFAATQTGRAPATALRAGIPGLRLDEEKSPDDEETEPAGDDDEDAEDEDAEDEDAEDEDDEDEDDEDHGDLDADDHPKVHVKEGDHISVDKEDREQHKKDRLKAQKNKKPSKGDATKKDKKEKKKGPDMGLGWFNKSHWWPSFFCFAQMMPYGGEEQLLISQFKARKGIFACNEFAVLCNIKRELGKGHKGQVVTSWVNPTPPVPMGGGAGTQTKSFLNTQTFINAWNILISSDALWTHDWTVKADPDAVFFPDRLRNHLWKHTKKEKMYYTLNCDYQGQPTLYGALEVFSKKALYNYEANKAKCDALDWRGKWGEDMYMHMCMITIGVSPLVDYNLVGDNRCMQAPCTDKWRAAFHDFKDPGSWWNCYCQSESCSQGQPAR